jgi:hypothetical protein
MPVSLIKIFACSDSFWPVAGLLVGLPLVAVAMTVQTALVDAVLFRVLLKKTAKRRFGLLLVANTLTPPLRSQLVMHG